MRNQFKVHIKQSEEQDDQCVNQGCCCSSPEAAVHHVKKLLSQFTITARGEEMELNRGEP
jgi:hypothetical protein